ncbi:unnamed protein product [Adineta ricciae]|uniref:Uncharacterized protein n=1 Tax=Adineta ricciae TaxID=249248 RepID=A0A815JTC0_ADIRI|nr:unnamed protein product [Adineta ricciae]CAF1597487.1 unnamed protein product [Adineta ricciae]
MVQTVAERAKRYREKLKRNQTKYNERKRKDRQRKALKNASMTTQEKDAYLHAHRQAQQRHRKKLKLNALNQVPSGSVYITKQTLSKAVKRVTRALPKNLAQQKQVLHHIGQGLGILPKPKLIRTQAQVPDSLADKVRNFYKLDSISWQAPGSVMKCVKQLKEKTPRYLCHVFVKRKQSKFFEYIKENADDGTVVCQVDYAENYTLQDQDQIQSAQWSKKQVSLFTAYAWFGGSGEEGHSFSFVSNSTTHDKFTVITCLEILVEEIVSMVPDVDQILFFSDGAASQFKNRYVVQHLTTMLNKLDIDITWNYFASSHGKGVVDSIGGILKRLVWLDVLAGSRCSSAKDFVAICRKKTTTITVGLIHQAQFDATRHLLEKTFKKTVGVPNIQKQHYIKALHQDVIEHSLYSTREEKYVFRF